MPLISGNYTPAVGILVQVAILAQTHMQALAASQKSGAQPADLEMFMALVDTGASTTCLSRDAAQKVALSPSGKTKMSGATGVGTVDQYTFGVGFLVATQQNPGGTITGNVSVHTVQGCEFTNHGLGFDVLLGRDILCKGGFAMTFDGHWHLAF